MTLTDLKEALLEHLVTLKIPRTIEPSCPWTPRNNPTVGMNWYTWTVCPLRTLDMLTEWLDELVHSGDLTEYHSIHLVSSSEVSVLRVTLCQDR